MTRPTPYAVPLDDLVASANVPEDEQVEQQDAGDRPGDDEAAGHLPGGVRPYGA